VQEPLIKSLQIETPHEIADEKYLQILINNQDRVSSVSAMQNPQNSVSAYNNQTKYKTGIKQFTL
jgi:hypothetical protein